ncbi:MAG: hypothetical protein QXG35_09560 [Nitrososphaerota archaeon]
MAKCMLCGKPGVTILVNGKSFSACVACMRALAEELSGFLASLGATAAAAPRRGRRGRRARAKAAAPMPADEFKRKLMERVEERGQISVYEFGRRHGFGRPESREIAKALAAEKNYLVEESGKKLVLKKPAPPA